MDVAVKFMLGSQIFGDSDEALPRIIRAFEDASGQEQSFYLVAIV